MGSWSATVTRWLADLFTAGSEAAPSAAPTAKMSGARAVLGIEARLCDTVWQAAGRDGEVLAGPVVVEHARGAIASAVGYASTGRRTAVLVDGDGLADIRDALVAAVRRHVPLVVHVALGRRSSAEDLAAGHEALAAVAEAGAWVTFARDVQDAVDRSLLARSVAETALVPAIVVMDGAETAWAEADVCLPSDALVGQFLGEVADDVDSPTVAQRALCGETRRRLPSAFDPDRPMAHGLISSGTDAVAAAVGQRVFFDEAVADIALASARKLANLTGRPLEQVLVAGVDVGGHVLFAAGALVPVAIAVAEDLASREGLRVGVVGLGVIAPLPLDALTRALGSAGSVTVVERAAVDPGQGGRLAVAVRAALAGTGVPVRTATCGVAADLPGPAAIEAIFRNMAHGADAIGHIDVGLTASIQPSSLPRRELLLQTIRRGYPQLQSRLVGAGAHVVDVAALEADLPLAVRRMAAHEGVDDIGRFWGEVVQPRRSGEAAVLEPTAAWAAAPAASAGLRDRSGVRTRLPEIDPAKCSGCGRCWVACPDSAIGATALGTEALLDFAAARVAASSDDRDPAADKLKRAHKQLSARLDGRLAKTGEFTLSQEVLRESYDWLATKIGATGDDRVAMDAAFGRCADTLASWPISMTQLFFHRPHATQKGSGQALVVAVDPRACQGCGGCEVACRDGAITVAADSAERVAAHRTVWRLWEDLPDTAGATVARVAEPAEIGPMAAVLMSRHALLATTGGDGAPPGSGERLAARQAIATVEYQMQRRALARLGELDRLRERLGRAVRERLAAALPAEDLARLDQALVDVPHRPANLGVLVERLDTLGGRLSIDEAGLRRLVGVARGVDDLRWRIATGPSGVGRARYGVVLTRSQAGRWAGRFPFQPFAVPVQVELAGDAPDLALGVARGLQRACLDEARLVRRAELELAPPSDWPDRERAIAGLQWADLSADERATCPPLLLIAGVEVLASGAEAGLSDLLSSDLPVKLLLLDDRALTTGAADPALVALAHRRAFVLSGSPAFADHLFAGVSGAVDFAGPAVLHVHAPSPQRHGFDTAATCERAQLAVASRVHPLLVYDPRRDGVFGSRIDLGGNPSANEDHALDEDGEAWTTIRWAQGEERFASQWQGATPSRALESAGAERRDHWRTLQELAGVRTPFVARLRGEIEAQVRELHEAQLRSLRTEHETALAKLQADHEGRAAARLRDRLMQLAGYSEAKPADGEAQGS